MDSKKPVDNKLPSIRTFAMDQKMKTGVSTKEVTLNKLSTEKKRSLSTTKKEEVKKSIPKPPKKTIPVPPIVKKENIVAVPKKVSPAPIPKEKNISAPANKKSTKKREPLVTIDNQNSASATIITDTKKDRFRLFPSITESIKSWVERFKTNRRARKTPKYTVPETTRRKGIIQKATSSTGKFASADHSIIYKKIRERRERDKAESSSPSWTPNTETVFPLLEETSSPHTSNVKIFPRKSFVTKHQEIVITDLEEGKSSFNQTEKLAEDTSTPEEIPTEPITKTEADDTRWETAEENQAPSKQITDIPSVKVVTPIPASNIEPQEVEVAEQETENKEIPKPQAPIIPKKNVEDKIDKSKENKPSFLLTNDTNSLAIKILIVILISVVVGIYAFQIFDTTMDSNESSTKNIASVNIPVETKYETNLNVDTLKAILDDFQPSEPRLLAFMTTEEEKVLLEPDTLLSVLNINLVPSFSKSISSLYFGKSRNDYTFITLTITDKIVAQGGLLTWEKSILSDLSSILDINVSTEINAKFIDGTLGGTDVRVLKDENGDEKIIYGFINNNTVIITNNSFSFGQLLQQTK